MRQGAGGLRHLGHDAHRRGQARGIGGQGADGRLHAEGLARQGQHRRRRPAAADGLLRGALCLGLRHPPGHPGVHPPARRRALCRCAGGDLPAQRAARHHRPHLRPPVPEQLHAAGLRQPAEDPRPEEGGAGKGLGRVPPPLAQARRHGLQAPGGRHRHGAGRPVGGLFPGACRAPGDAVRARSQRRRGVRAHRAALPPV